MQEWSSRVLVHLPKTTAHLIGPEAGMIPGKGAPAGTVIPAGARLPAGKQRPVAIGVAGPPCVERCEGVSWMQRRLPAIRCSRNRRSISFN
jgi:hypothetical protein